MGLEGLYRHMWKRRPEGKPKECDQSLVGVWCPRDVPQLCMHGPLCRVDTGSEADKTCQAA